MFEVLDPTNDQAPMEFSPAARLGSIEGAIIGIVSNGKHGSVALFDGVAQRLLELGAANVERVVKDSYSAPATVETMSRAARWQAMVAGIGD